MRARQYAVVCYVNGELARFAEELRSQFTPHHAHLRAHLTLLGPRPLVLAGDASANAEEAAVAVVESACKQLAAIRAGLGEVRTFVPAHPTVYIEVEHGARHLRYLHGLLNTGVLGAPDTWDYIPHLTLGTFADCPLALAAQPDLAGRWARYVGPREFMVRELELVREDSPDRWSDLNSFSLT